MRNAEGLEIPHKYAMNCGKIASYGSQNQQYTKVRMGCITDKTRARFCTRRYLRIFSARRKGWQIGKTMNELALALARV